jgi:hypothetical protein
MAKRGVPQGGTLRVLGGAIANDAGDPSSANDRWVQRIGNETLDRREIFGGGHHHFIDSVNAAEE